MNSRTIKTLHFGEINVEDDHIFTFPNGILGFEELREFVLISEEETVPFKWLISLEKPEIGFPILSPWHLDIEYDPGNDFDLEKQVLFAVVTLEDEKGLMTANLKAPIVFNIETQTGEQVILAKDKYVPNFVISGKKENER
jgi:flagellar assembly factor FliW